jgi:putative YhdH/YhfP family quinone oxidoreductase
MSKSFKALVVEQVDKRKFVSSITERTLDDLPQGNVLIRVHYSSLNYKDALSSQGNPGVTTQFPHTPGIDAAGEVVESDSSEFSVGDKVLVTGFDLGMNTSGGFGEYIRVPDQWVLSLPDSLSAREAMIYGTAGFTAAISVQKLVDAGVTPDSGEILVTGATGGVGSVAVAILAKAGYSVVALTGKAEQEAFLKSLGALQVIGRDELLEKANKPLMRERWAGVVDCVGGDFLAAAIKSCRYDGVVTCCGLTASTDLPLNVFPFILRGVSLLGVDSVQFPYEKRAPIWNKLANEWKLNSLESLVDEIGFSQLEDKIQSILSGKIVGRTLLKLSE